MCLVALFVSTEYPIYCHADSRTDKMRYFRRLSVKYAGDTWHRSQYNQGYLSNINHKEVRVRNNKKHWVLLLGLIVMLLGSAIGCVQPGFTTYNNDIEGYSISYPLNWQVEVSEDGTVYYISSPTRRASVKIVVVEGMTARAAANYLVMSITEGTPGKEVTLIEDKPMQGAWDWYLSYEYETSYYETFRGEAYFKQTEKHLYRLDTAGDADGYKNYPFSTIISSFKLK